MNYSEMKFWFDVAQTLLICVVGVMNWHMARQRATTETINHLEHQIDNKLDEHAERLARVEQDVKHAPGHDDFKRVHQRLDNVNGELRELKGEVKAFRIALARVEQYLLEKK